METQNNMKKDNDLEGRVEKAESKKKEKPKAPVLPNGSYNLSLVGEYKEKLAQYLDMDTHPQTYSLEHLERLAGVERRGSNSQYNS